MRAAAPAPEPVLPPVAAEPAPDIPLFPAPPANVRRAAPESAISPTVAALLTPPPAPREVPAPATELPAPRGNMLDRPTFPTVVPNEPTGPRDETASAYAGGSVLTDIRPAPATDIPAPRTELRDVALRRSTSAQPAPDAEPWNPDTTYDSLVRLLAELQALYPQEVAVLPKGPRRRVFRRTGQVLAIAAAGALVVGGSSVLLSHRHHPAARAAVAVAPVMSTVLVTLDKDGSLKGATLLARDKNATQEVLVPSRLLVDVPGQGNTQLSAAPLSGPNAASDAVENALHVRIGGTWIIDPTALSTLVDAIGGVDVTLTDDVLPQDGSNVVGVGAGTSHLTGAQAVVLAYGLGSQEPEASRLARQQILLEALLTKLPASPDKLAGLLQNAQLSGGLTASSLAATLELIRGDVAGDHAASTLLPTNEIDSGSGLASYGLDEQATETMVGQRLAGAELPMPAAGRSRILVQNGIGTPGLGDAARTELVSRGYIFRGGGNVTQFGAGPSVVLIPDSSSASRALGATIAQVLGLPPTAVELDPTQTTIADVVVILGADFTPKAPTNP